MQVTTCPKELTMKSLTALIVIGPLTIGAVPAVAQSALPLASGAPMRLAAADPATDRDTYTQKARGDLREWQQKLQGLGEKTETMGKKADSAAKNDLNEAWSRTEAASRRLETVGAEGWKDAKIDYEKASRDLAAAWQKFHPEPS
jgi:hypothetical protein